MTARIVTIFFYFRDIHKLNKEEDKSLIFAILKEKKN